MVTFIISVNDFFLRIPGEYQGPQVTSDRFDSAIRATGEQLASSLGGTYLYHEDDADAGDAST